MIYLIGGPPKCGKTTLAKRLAEKYQIPWISADTLQNIVKAYTPEEKYEFLFPHSYLRKVSNNDEFYDKYSTSKIIENYIEQGKTTYDAISMVVETYLADADNFIIEGYQVTPEVVDKILKRFGTENIKAVFLVKHDKQKFIQDLHKSNTPNDWILQKTKNESTFTKIAKMIAEYSSYFEKEANQYGFDVFIMDENFDEKLDDIDKYLRKN